MVRLRLALPLAFAALAASAAAGCGGGDDAATTTTAPTHTTVQSAKEAVAITRDALAIDLPASDVRALLVDLCAASTTGNAQPIVHDLQGLALPDTATLAATITALGKGAEAYCPDGVAVSPNLLHDVYDAVSPSVGTGSSTTTIDQAATVATTPKPSLPPGVVPD